MAKLQFAANAPGNDEGLEDYTPLAPGDYIAMITKSGYKQTKAKTGNYLQLIWKVTSGEGKGRTLFDNLNLDNPNPIAVEIANKSLNSICKACQKVGVQDSEELHGIPCKLTLSVEPKTATQPASNNIKGYAPVSPEELQAAIETGANRPAQAEAPGNVAVGTPQKLPWE